MIVVRTAQPPDGVRPWPPGSSTAKPSRNRSARTSPPTSRDGRPRPGVVPGLTVVLVGDNPASQVYVRNKQNACKAAGMGGTVVRLPADTAQAALVATIDRLNADPAVHGILVQLPLPPQIDERAILERVDPKKDVDGFHPLNIGLLASGIPRFVPCTPLGIRELLCHAGVETRARTPSCSAARRSSASRWRCS